MRLRVIFALLIINLFWLENLNAEADPFDKQQRLAHALSTESSNEVRHHCDTESTVVAEHISFQQLKLIGMMQYTTTWKAFFMDNEKHIYTAMVGNLISKEQLKLQQISRKNIQLLAWDEAGNCQQTRVVNIKF
ncbi:pilus assembly protein PilP [Pasteurella bettyae]|uniref:Pilus assembly protein PilP n=1 Tax=Pasteurella bettyae CCUG 2042 TaxID=1095749 RepID=I3D6N2_9PAST|nr:pilus assembly protein PilP [Pasteurella bettyae]EIJ67375.1 pilus assembly protein PilP [Pasteurella bettyae CCUG 2042]SUB21278.1 protein ComD [Pasteurella bettyae]